MSSTTREQRRRSRLGRYAALAVPHGVIVVLALAGVLGGDPWPLVGLASVPLFFAWGAYHADVATNEALHEAERVRWHVILGFVPWAMTAYWARHVR